MSTRSKPKRLKRNRGVILTSEGWQKLKAAKSDWEFRENYGNRFTLEELGARAELTPVTLRKILTREEGVDKRSLVGLFMALSLELSSSDYVQPNQNSAILKRLDWLNAPDISQFCGRTIELATLEQWLERDRCRLITILGMGGIGKTSLATKLGQLVKNRFEYVIWYSLRDAPPLKELLATSIQFLTDEQETEASDPDASRGISRLIDCLRASRCLLILDNMESVLGSSGRAGICRDGYEGYGKLLRRVGEADHQSCLLLTSREKPREVAALEGEALKVRTFRLDGFQEGEGEEILEAKGLTGSEQEFSTLVEHYAGNALALKIVGTTICDLFGGNIAEFLQQDTAVFGDVRVLLDEQFERLSPLEQEILYWLAINREPTTLSELREDMVSKVPQLDLLEGLESVSRRSLVEQNQACFSLQPVVMEYVICRLIEKVCREIETASLQFFRCYALIKATAKDYIRETQIRLILQPIIDRLLAIFRSQKSIEERLIQILATQRETFPREPGYVGGNAINLLRQIGTDLTGYDFSNLAVWQADLRCVCLHDVSFENADLSKSQFAETFGGVLSVAFSPDGKFLATGDTKGEICLRQVEDGKLIFTLKGHDNWLTTLAFSPDGSRLASGSTDFIVKLWDISTGQCLKTFQEHSDEVWSVAFSPDGEMLASGSDDQTTRLWNVRTGECKRIFQEGNTNWVASVAFSPDGQILASGGGDHTIRLWDINVGRCLKAFHGHYNGIRALMFNPDGQILASGSEDQTVKLWDVSAGECLKTFQGHSHGIFSIAFSLQGDLLASGSYDQTTKLWNVRTGECLKTFRGHTGRIWSIAFSPRGDLLASGSHNQTAKIWDVSTGFCLNTFQGNTNQMLSVVFSPDGQSLASGSHDCMIRLWDVNTGEVLRIFQGHTNRVLSVDFSPDGQTIASSSEDRTVRLWNVNTGEVLRIFQGHTNQVTSITFSPDGQTIASSSEDRTVRLWDINTGEVLRIFQGHNAEIWSVAFSPQGTMLASGAFEPKLRIWDISIGECKRTLEGHTSWVWSVAFSSDGNVLASTSPDGTLRLWSVSNGECKRILRQNTGWFYTVTFSPDSRMLASCSQNYTVKLWNVSTGESLKSLQGHTGRVWSVAWSQDNQTLASSSEDETIRLWNTTTGKCLTILKSKKLYERMNIMRAKGITETTIATLKTLGAY